MRLRLLDAATMAFSAHGYRGASVQRIAREAGATPAMVHYYFGNKRGLYRAMLEHTLGPVFEAMQSGVREVHGADDPLEAFVRIYMHSLAKNPEIPALLLRDVLDPDAEMRDEFIEGFAKRGGGLVREILESERNAGRLRADLDTNLAAMSLMSMAAFPFLAASVVERVFGVRHDTGTIDRLATHTLTLFRHGTEAA